MRCGRCAIQRCSCHAPGLRRASATSPDLPWSSRLFTDACAGWSAGSRESANRRSDRRPSAVVGAWQLCGSVPAELFRMPDSARISRCVRFHLGRKRPAQLCLSACIYAGHTVEAIKAGTRPRYHPIHLVQKHALARSLGRQDQSQVSLLHGSRRLGRHASCEARIGPSCAEHPSTFLNQRSGRGKVGHGNAIARRGG